MSQIPLFIVDAFTGILGNRELRGNPAAVAVLESARDEAWMQSVAAEMNLSETAFVVRREAGNFDLRWFTPEAEVQLCGHATLASARVLWELGELAPDDPAHFHTLSGVLTARKQEDWIELDFPVQTVKITSSPRGLAESLGIEPRTPVSYWKAEDDWVLEISSGLVETLRPNFSLLLEISRHLGCRGICVTAAGNGSEYDFVSRFFGPAVGVNEDPVTGSAHTKLAPFWGKQLGKTEMTGYQASRRGGLVGVTWKDQRVLLRGQSSVFLRGTLED